MCQLCVVFPITIDYMTTLAKLLNEWVEADGRSIRKLSDMIAQEWGETERVPHRSITHWLNGKTQKPRDWRGLLKLAHVLRKTEAEANELLTICRHATLEELRLTDDDPLLYNWVEPSHVEAPFQAPPLTSTFTGRQTIIQEIEQALRSSTSRSFVSLQGMGGVGKTTLAIQMAYRLRDWFPDGVLWAKVDSSDGMSILQNFATSFGADVSHYTDLDSRASKVRALLARKKVLLIFDDATEDAQVRPLLPPTGSCAVLLTTRRTDLAVADLSKCIDLTPFTEAESLTLWSRLLGEGRVEQERPLFRQLSHYLGHLPLAITICGQRLKYEVGWQTVTFWQRLQSAPIQQLQRGDLVIQQSFQLSYEALTPEQQMVFRACGLFGGLDFSFEAVTAVLHGDLMADEVGDYLRHLVNLSLVGTSGSLSLSEGATSGGEGNGRLQLHPLLRQFALDLGSDPIWQARQIAYFVTYAETAPDPTPEESNIDYVLTQIEPNEWLVRGILAMAPYWQTKGHYQKAQTYLQKGLGVADTLAQIQLHTHLGRIASRRGELTAADRHYQTAQQLAQAEGQPVTEWLIRRGALAYRQGLYDHAQQFYEEAQQMADNPIHSASALANLGQLARQRGDLHQAKQYCEQALPMARQANHPPLLIATLQQFGNLQEDEGNYAFAKAHLLEALPLAEQLGDPELLSRVLGNLGLTACHLQNYAEARAHFRQGLALAEKAEIPVQTCRQKANLGYLCAQQGKYNRANAHYEEALALAKQLGFPRDVMAITMQWGISYLGQEQLRLAQTYLAEAEALARDHDWQIPLAETLFAQAKLAYQRENMEKARRLATESQGIYTAVAHPKADDVAYWLAALPRSVEG